MNSKAQFPIFIIVTSIVALVVAVIVIFGWNTFYGFFVSIINVGSPTFNETGTIGPGTNYVGILISPIVKTVSGSMGAVSRPSALLYYLTGRRNVSHSGGTGWQEVEESTFKVGTKSLDAIATRDALAYFYFSTPRIGNPKFTLNNGQLLSVSIPSGGLFEGHGLTLWYNGSTATYFAPNNLFYKDDLTKKRVSDYDSVSEQATIWRDQILQGFPCEKFISLTFTEGEQEITRVYTLKKNEVKDGFYLYVDLDEPAVGNERYGEGCYSNAA